MWENAKGKVTKEHIAEIEKSWQVKLPADYIACVKKFNRGRPESDGIEIPGRGETDFQCLLDVTNTTDTSVLATWGRMQKHFPKGIFPFGTNSGGCFFVFDYRETDGEDPTIAFWDYNKAAKKSGDPIYPICDTFTELESLFIE